MTPLAQVTKHFPHLLHADPEAIFHKALELVKPELYSKIAHIVYSNPQWNKHMTELVHYYQGNPHAIAQYLQSPNVQQL